VGILGVGWGGGVVWWGGGGGGGCVGVFGGGFRGKITGAVLAKWTREVMRSGCARESGIIPDVGVGGGRLVWYIGLGQTNGEGKKGGWGGGGCV